MEIIIGFIILYAIQYLLCYGMLFGYLQGGWSELAVKSRSRDRGMALLCGGMFALVPLVGVFVAFCITGCNFHGFKFK